MLDLNGDGINDLYHYWHSSRNGSGATVPWAPSVERSVWFGLGDGTYLMLSDQPIFPQYTTIPPGVEWEMGFNLTGSIRKDSGYEIPDSNGLILTTSMRDWDTIDMNGDGLLDQVIFPTPPASGTGDPWYRVIFHPGPAEGLLETVTNELGGVTRLTYKPSTWFRKSAQATTQGEGQPETTLPASVRTAPVQWLLASLTVEDGRTTEDQTQSIEYAEPRYDTERHEYLGARMAESVDAASVLTRRFFHQLPELRGRLEFMEVENAAETLLRTAKTTWTSVPTPGESGTPVPGSSFAKATETLTVLRDPTNPNASQTHGISRTFDDATGNLLTETDWGADGAQGTTDDLIRTLTYAPTPSGDWMTSYVTEDSLSFGSSPQQPVSSIVSHYDATAPGASPGPIRCTGSGPPCGGQVSFRQTLREAPSTWATEHWQYDVYGNVTQYFDPETYLAFSGEPSTSPTQTTVYDASGAFPQTVTNALGHAWNYHFDEGLGEVDRVLEPNGHLGCWIYDDFGRLSERREETAPVDPQNIEDPCLTLLASFTFNDLGMPGQQHITEILETGEDQVRRLRFFDGLGREYQTEDEYKQGEFDVVKRSWGDRGELVCETLPYRRGGDLGGWSTVEACDDQDQVTGQSHRITSYDALLRPTQTDLIGKDEAGSFQAVTELTRLYGVNSWAGGDPGLGDLLIEKRKTLTGQGWDRTQYIGVDPRGQVVLAREVMDDSDPENIAVADTVLIRDPKGRITRVDGPDFTLQSGTDENLLDISYNAVDQRRSLSQPQTGAGGGVPPWLYYYNLNGDLKLQISPQAVGTQFIYDELGRLRLRDYFPFNTPANPGAGDVVYEYHDSGYGIGQLATAYSVNGLLVTDYDYDLRGRLASKARDFGGPAPYAFGYDYDLLDRPTVTVLPDSGTLTYSYVAGALTQLESALPGSGDVDVRIDGIEHSASGGLELLQAQAVSLSGPPIATVYSYRPTDDRLEGVATTVDPGGTPELVQDFFYEYDTAGNLLSVDDGLDKLDQGFAYDRLHRLTLAGGLGSQGYGLLQYEYDDAGNLLGKGPGTNGSPQNGRVRLAYGRPPNGGPPSVVSVDYHNGSNWINGFGAFEYDADGGMVQRRVLVSTWDQPEGRDGAGRIYYTDLPGNEYAFYYYDHEGQRFERDRLAGGQPQVWHEYVDPSFEADWLANTHEVHLFVDARRVATLKRPGRGATETSPTTDVQFHLTDHVGSNSLVADASGEVVQESFLKPFGDVYAMLIDGQAVSNADSSLTPYLFTDQERDAETDLHYFGARYYDPWVGRFMSQDPELIGSSSGITFRRIRRDPQQFNAYSYVRNSPTVLTDPTGRQSIWDSIRSNDSIGSDVAGAVERTVEKAAEGASPGELLDHGIAEGDAMGNSIGAGDSVGEPPSRTLGEAVDAGAEGAAAAQEALGGEKAAENTTTGGAEQATGNEAGSGTALPDSAWSNDSPRQVTPGTRDLQHTKYNEDTGEGEQSMTTYDEYGRQVGRTDYTDHGYPETHTSPHHHTTEYGPGYSYKGKESGPQPGPLPGHPEQP